MSVCTVQDASMGQDVPNIFMQARLDAGFKSRGKATEFVPLCEKTLTRIETDRKTPTPDEVVSMVQAYDQEKLYFVYCEDICPIGKKIMEKSEERDLSGATIGVLRVVKDIQQHLDRMIEIAEDNLITPDEIPDLEMIMEAIFTLESRLSTYKRRVSRAIKLDKLLQGRRQKQKPLAVAERRAGYSF